jgi:hypothetical protein
MVSNFRGYYSNLSHSHHQNLKGKLGEFLFYNTKFRGGCLTFLISVCQIGLFFSTLNRQDLCGLSLQATSIIFQFFLRGANIYDGIFCANEHSKSLPVPEAVVINNNWFCV